MKFNVIVIFLFLSAHFYTQKLSFFEKTTCRKIIRKMDKRDQYYRMKMIKNSGLNNDSIWKLQSINDSINKIAFVNLINKYGYPSNKRIKLGANTFGILLHQTLEKDYIDLLDLFQNELQKGNMEAFYFAIWYDRCQVNMNKENKYGAYGKKDFCGKELEQINENRKQIGLAPLKSALDCP